MMFKRLSRKHIAVDLVRRYGVENQRLQSIRSTTTITRSTGIPSESFPIYNSFLEDLKNKKDIPGRNALYNKSFSEINGDFLNTISREETQEVA